MDNEGGIVVAVLSCLVLSSSVPSRASASRSSDMEGFVIDANDPI
jgi:hypothetical protein